MRRRSLFSNALILLVFCVVNIATAQAATPVTSVTSANCPTLTCVRQHIDNIDQQIVKLLGQRLAYVKRAGELKAQQKSIHDQAREDTILQTVAQQAKANGYPSEIAVNVFKTILAQANIYERRINKNCLPHNMQNTIRSSMGPSRQLRRPG